MWELKSKYCFKGILEMKTALHIGGGKENFRNTDSPVIRTPEGYPFIPGSSFKGAFRSLTEKIANSIPGVSSCQLIDDSDICCPAVNQKKFTDRKKKIDENMFVKILEQELCDTCKLFGSPYTASKIIFHDLMMINPSSTTQIRDGVVIDRDSETAVERFKYDFEVVPPFSEFDMEIWLENPSDMDIGLACLGLNEFLSEMSYIGGIKSRGLGNCRVTHLKIYKLELTNGDKDEKLIKYLLNSDLKNKMDNEPEPLEFIRKNIEQLFKNKDL